MRNYRLLLKPKPLPAHIAIIMDGNGRWAKKRSLPRSEGHRKGAEVIELMMDAAIELGIKVVSLFVFSTENWTRPRTEILHLWKLLDEFFKKKIDKIQSAGIRVVHSGSTKRLPSSTRRAIDNAIASTEKNKKIILNFCINYGGRQEIVDAVNKWNATAGRGEQLTEKKLEQHLYSRDLPNVDLLIRTSGECRISNFLLWQVAYAEMIFTDVLWPDFSSRHLYKAVYEYQQRERRFGGI